MGTQTGPATLEGSLILQQNQAFLLFCPITVLLGIYPKELKPYAYRKICTQKFIAALFLITKTWKQLQYSSVPKWKINGGTSRQWNIV